MSLIDERVRMLRELALINKHTPKSMFLKHCADTIEELSSKVRLSNLPKNKECSRCIHKGRCAIHDNFNIDYCSDWRDR